MTVFVYFFVEGGSAYAKTKMMPTTENGLYEITVPQGAWTHMKIGRCPQTDYNSWTPNGNNWPSNVYNETGNLKIQTSAEGNLYHANYVTKWYDNGNTYAEWSNYTRNPS